MQADNRQAMPTPANGNRGSSGLDQLKRRLDADSVAERIQNGSGIAHSDYVIYKSLRVNLSILGSRLLLELHEETWRRQGKADCSSSAGI
jgi:hypothetical protein